MLSRWTKVTYIHCFMFVFMYTYVWEWDGNKPNTYIIVYNKNVNILQFTNVIIKTNVA